MLEVNSFLNFHKEKFILTFKSELIKNICLNTVIKIDRRIKIAKLKCLKSLNKVQCLSLLFLNFKIHNNFAIYSYTN